MLAADADSVMPCMLTCGPSALQHARQLSLQGLAPALHASPPNNLSLLYLLIPRRCYFLPLVSSALLSSMSDRSLRLKHAHTRTRRHMRWNMARLSSQSLIPAQSDAQLNFSPHTDTEAGANFSSWIPI